MGSNPAYLCFEFGVSGIILLFNSRVDAATTGVLSQRLKLGSRMDQHGLITGLQPNVAEGGTLDRLTTTCDTGAERSKEILLKKHNVD